MMITTAENRYVGTANARPASRIPRRLPKHIRITMAIEIRVMSAGWLMADTADATAAVPAAICTATVTT